MEISVKCVWVKKCAQSLGTVEGVWGMCAGDDSSWAQSLESTNAIIK